VITSVILAVDHSQILDQVCGICPLSSGLAVNTHQFAQLVNRSKSSVNGLFVQIGSQPSPMTADEQSLEGAARKDSVIRADGRGWESTHQMENASLPEASDRRQESSLFLGPGREMKAKSSHTFF
jgi:hypothetical protein